MARTSSPEDSEDSASSENPEVPTPAETAPEEDWGIAPPSGGMSRETKLGFAFVFVLVVVFGFVVYKKVEHNRAEREFLAGAQQPAPATKPASQPENTAQNPIAENPFPPVQNEFPEPAELSPASWNQESFESPPQKHTASTPPANKADSSASIDQFPPADFDPPVETTSSQPFPQEPAFENTQAQTAIGQQASNPSPFPADTVAQSPTPQQFEPPAPFENENEVPEQTNAQKTGSPAYQPFGEEVIPARPGSQETAQTPDFENEQFSAQSEPVPEETVQTPPAGNPFGEFPASQAAEPESAEPATTAAAGATDPFTVTSQAEAPANEAQAFDPNQFSPPESSPPVEMAQPETFPAGNDPRFGDFRPAPYEANPSGAPNELPADVLTQLTSAEIAGGTTGQMRPSDRPAVHIVRPGDNYWSISKKQYGSVRYFMALARYNQQRIPDPKKMRPGMKVLTPTREILETRNPDLFPKYASKSAGISNVAHQTEGQTGFYVEANGAPMYRVGPNDTLGGIAQKHLGRFSRWVEIYQLNRHRLKNPNALTLGDVLQLPADASRVSMVRQASGIR